MVNFTIFLLAEYSDLTNAIETIQKKTKQKVGLLIDDAQKIFTFPFREYEAIIESFHTMRLKNEADIILIFSEMSQAVLVNQSIFIKKYCSYWIK